MRRYPWGIQRLVSTHSGGGGVILTTQDWKCQVLPSFSFLEEGSILDYSKVKGPSSDQFSLAGEGGGGEITDYSKVKGPSSAQFFTGEEEYSWLHKTQFFIFGGRGYSWLLKTQFFIYSKTESAQYWPIFHWGRVFFTTQNWKCQVLTKFSFSGGGGDSWLLKNRVFLAKWAKFCHANFAMPHYVCGD